MSAENTKDSFYQLFVSADGQSGTFKKVERLLKCDPPNEAKEEDDITSTEDRQTVKAPVDFKSESQIEFEYVLLPDDETHKLLQTSFDTGKELTFQFKFIEVPSESREFKGMISDLTVNAEDTKRKLRKKGKITITSKTKKELTA